MNIIEICCKEITEPGWINNMEKFCRKVLYNLQIDNQEVSFLLCNDDLKSGEEHHISNYIFTHLIPVGKLALRKKDDYSIIDVAIAIQNIGDAAAENKLEKVTYGAIINLRDIGIEAVNQDLEWPAQMVVIAIEKIGQTSVKKGLKILMKEGGWWEVSYLKTIGVKAIEWRLENVAQSVASSLGIVGMMAAESDLRNTLSQSIISLGIITDHANIKKLPKVIETTSESLRFILDVTPTELDEFSKAMKALERANAYAKKYSNE